MNGLYNYTIENSIRIEFWYDHENYLVALLEISNTDDVKIEVCADLGNMSALDMRELWTKLKFSILPTNFMEDIRASVLVHLQNAGRADLVAVCLDSATPRMEAMRL